MSQADQENTARDSMYSMPKPVDPAIMTGMRSKVATRLSQALNAAQAYAKRSKKNESYITEMLSENVK